MVSPGFIDIVNDSICQKVYALDITCICNDVLLDVVQMWRSTAVDVFFPFMTRRVSWGRKSVIRFKECCFFERDEQSSVLHSHIVWFLVLKITSTKYRIDKRAILVNDISKGKHTWRGIRMFFFFFFWLLPVVSRHHQSVLL